MFGKEFFRLFCLFVFVFVLFYGASYYRCTHLDSDVIGLCAENFVKIGIITAGFTGQLSVLDLTVNSQFKRTIKTKFRNWVLRCFYAAYLIH